ncbi:MAG: hypothetical protein L0H53_12540 [Candidatus Nitrosocosmicus sp.]|nr:hypothetical protein [Candidatus Nitrosocosmicus sp.]MDN5867185.1 hypothetical protein [Candidatus Nitrosocosmicus sp.]
MSIITPISIFVMGYGISATSQALGSNVTTDIGNNQSESIPNPNSISSSIPSNISVTIEPKDTGTLYLSAIISNGDVNFTRNLDDELFPFQVVNWYQLTKFTPNFEKTSNLDNLNVSGLIVGPLQDFDEYADLLEQARTYSDVPFDETFILDVPNRDVSFMLLQIDFSNGDKGIYYGLYDGNQEHEEKSEISLRLNPESSLKILESVSADEMPLNEPLYNVTKKLVCNDLYKLGYEKCM